MTPDQLRQATGCSQAASIAFASPIASAIKKWGVSRVPEFLGQIAVESGRLSRLIENMHYTTPERLMQVWPSRFMTIGEAIPYLQNPEKLANLVYGGRMGNVQPGDGWRFIGRGLKQLTGRANYQAYQLDSEVPVLVDPNKLLDPFYAADSAGWFWSSNKCDEIAHDPKALTRRINGGLNGLRERIQLTALAREVFA